MLKHLVFMKFKPEANADKIAEMENKFSALPEIIKEIRGYQFGRDVVQSERSYDFALVSDFDDLDAMNRYQIHPSHQEIVAIAKTICDDIKAVDFSY